MSLKNTFQVKQWLVYILFTRVLGHYQTLLENEEESIEMSNVMLDVGLTGDMIDIGAAHDKLLTHIKTCFHLPVIYCLLKKKHFSPYLMLDLYFLLLFLFLFLMII